MLFHSFYRACTRLLLIALLGGLLPGASGAAHSAPAPAGPAAPASLPAPQQPTPRALGPFPLAFVGNAGQSDAAVRFLVRSRAGTLFFNDTEAVLAVPVVDPNAPRLDRGRQRGLPKRIGGTSVVRLRYDGASPKSELRPGLQLPGVVNYLTGSDPRAWLTNLATFDSLSYSQLYAGIDLRYDGVDGQLKRSYVVRQGRPQPDPLALPGRG